MNGPRAAVIAAAWFHPPPAARTKWLVSAVLATWAAWLVAYSTAPFGASAWHFAMNNIGAAEGLLSGRGLSSNRGEPFVLWGPLLPALLAALELAGLRLLDGARWLTIASACVFVGLHARLLFETARSLWTGVAASAMLILSPQFLPIAASVRSQPLFVALTMASLWSLLRYLATGRAAWLWTTALIGVASSLHRYDGVLHVAATALVVLVRPSAGKLARRLGAALLLCALPALALVAWLARNWAVSGSLLGERRMMEGGQAVQLLDGWHTLTLWLVPWTNDLGVRTGIVLALGVAGAAALARRLSRGENERSRDALAVYACFPLIYGGGLLASAAVFQVDRIGERLLFPLAPFVLGFVLLSFEELLAFLRARSTALAALPVVAAALVIVLHLRAGVTLTVREVERMRTQGAGGISDPNYSGAKLARWLREHPLEGAAYSNWPEYVMLFADRSVIPAGEQDVAQAVRILRAAPEPAYLIWIGSTEQERAQLVELQSQIGLEVIATLATGVVLRVRR